MKMTGSQALIETLIAQGVDTIFGYPGGAIMPIYDALFEYTDKIRHILVRHEQGAAHAAEGYARIKNRAGICFATSGPGATNLVTGIADAMMDSVPLVCITGQVASPLLGTDAFQETDIVGITTPITKWNYQVTSAKEIPSVIAKAFAIATMGRPGPVLIDVTKNAQIEEADFDLEKDQYFSMKSLPAKFGPSPEIMKQAAEIINTSQQPLLLVGHGVLISRAQQELYDFAQKADIPVAVTLHGLSAYPSRDPLFVGMLGMHGNYAPNLLTNQADVIIAVGMRFDDRVTGRLSSYAKQAKIIHIEIDRAEINKNVQTYIPIQLDAKVALGQLNELIQENDHSDWRNRFQTLYEQEFRSVIQPELAATEETVKMAHVIRSLSDKTLGRAVIVADVGQHQMITARYYQFAQPNSFITSGGLGTMGFALPASIGAQIASKREVIAVIGDGCFQMTIQELATIAQEKLPIKIILLNNNYLGMVRQWQQLFFDKRYSFVELENPDFVTVAQGFHIEGEKIDKYSELDGAIERMLEADGAYLLEVVVEKEANVFPMIPTGASVEEVRLS